MQNTNNPKTIKVEEDFSNIHEVINMVLSGDDVPYNV